VHVGPPALTAACRAGTVRRRERLRDGHVHVDGLDFEACVPLDVIRA